MNSVFRKEKKKNNKQLEAGNDEIQEEEEIKIQSESKESKEDYELNEQFYEENNKQKHPQQGQMIKNTNFSKKSFTPQLYACHAPDEDDDSSFQLTPTKKRKQKFSEVYEPSNFLLDSQNKQGSQQSYDQKPDSNNNLISSHWKFDKHSQIDLFETGKFHRLFTEIQEIGKGGFSYVYSAIHKIENTCYAVKRVFLWLSLDERIEEHKLFREVSMLRELNHKNVLRYYSFWVEEPTTEFQEAFMKFKANREFEVRDKIRGKLLQNLEEENEGSDLFEQQSEINKTNLEDFGFEWEADENQEENESNNAGVQHKNSKIRIELQSIQNNSTNNQSQDKDKLIQHSNQEKFIQQPSQLYSIDSSYEVQIQSIFNSTQPSQNKYPFYLNIQMQYCAGKTLKDYLESKEREEIDPQESFDIFVQILEGVKYIHKKGIIHRDLKPSNIFIDKNIILIGDFGLAAKFQDKTTLPLTFPQLNFQSSTNSSQSYSLTNDIGTPLYTAPEQESYQFHAFQSNKNSPSSDQKKQQYNEKVDTYSLGIILLELFTLMQTSHQKFAMVNDLKQFQKLPSAFINDYYEESQLILQMTEKNSVVRPYTLELENTQEFKNWSQKYNYKNQKIIHQNDSNG